MKVWELWKTFVLPCKLLAELLTDDMRLHVHD